MWGSIDIDQAIAALAARQGGVVTRKQLRGLGFSDTTIDRRVRAGRLHRVYPGVFAVGHPLLGALGRRWAAVLACGEDATLSDAAAAAAFGFRASDAARIDVTVPPGRSTKLRAIRIHRRTLVDDERTQVDGLPITTPARTLLDLAAGGLRGKRLGTAIDRSFKADLLDFADLQLLIERHRGRPGTPALREAVQRYVGGDTRSELELIVAELCDRHGIPRPQENVVVAGAVRDFYWPAHNLVVEADSFAWHSSPQALDDDRERDVQLALAGIQRLRFTYAQATRRRAYVARSILAALSSPPGGDQGASSRQTVVPASS